MFIVRTHTSSVSNVLYCNGVTQHSEMPACFNTVHCSLISVDCYHINKCVIVKRGKTCVFPWCEWRSLRCLLCLIFRLKERYKQRNFLSLLFPLNVFLTSPRRHFILRTYTFTPILSYSFPVTNTETLLESEWSTEGWR